MKYFSLDFTLNKGDYGAYYKDFGKAIFLNQVKRSAISIILMAVLLSINLTSERIPEYIAALVFLIFIYVAMPVVYSKKLAVSLLNSRNNKRKTVYDFYADHIEVHIDDESSEASTEKHLKMNGFVSVAESKTNFYFSYMNERVLIIPKRVLDAEKYGMIKNLIENYFSNVYMSI